MIKKLTEKRYAGSMSWIVPVDQLKVGIGYQRNRTCCQIVVRIQDPTETAQIHKRVANGVRWRRERWQITEHPTKTSGHCYIGRPLSMLRPFP